MSALALDLFCGAGGAGLGLEEAGFRVIGYDAWQPAIDTHKANGRHALLADLKTRDLGNWRGRVTLVWGSPPCQPFSQAGSMRGREDERNCVPDFIDRLREIDPPAFVMENVPGLTTKRFRGYFAMIRARLRVLGYRVEWRVLNSADYGVPQTRKRLFVVGVKGGVGFTWPEPTHAKEDWVSMASALGWGDVVAISNYGTGGDSRKRGRRGGGEPFSTVTSKVDRVVLRHNAGERNRPRDPTTGKQIVREGNKDYYLRYEADIPAPLVTTQSSAWAWTAADRDMNDATKITPAEAACLQDFPDGYVFTGNKTATFTQIGNAVPRTMARVLALGFVFAQEGEEVA